MASPSGGKLSPQVTDEGALSGHFPLIRRIRATFPQRGKAFSATQKSRCRCFHLHRRSYFFGVISLITLIRYFSDWSLIIIGTASYLLRSFLNPWLILRVHGSIPFSEWLEVSGLGLMLRATPLNSCTLEYLLVDQVNFRLLGFGGVITVISTSLLSLDLCNTLRSFWWAASALC